MNFHFLKQTMDPSHLRDEHELAAVLPPPHDSLGYCLRGVLMLCHRACSAIVSSGAPRTFIRPGYARGMGFHSVPRPGEHVQSLDGSWRQVTEHHYPILRIAVSGFTWRVRAVEGGTGPFDLVLGADWLYYHRAVVDLFERTLTLGVPGGRVVLRFLGAPAVLAITSFVQDPPAAPAVPLAQDSEPEEDPEEEPVEDEVDPVIIDD